MNSDTFFSLPAAELAAWMRQRDPLVCAFPVNGTRRWFMLEHPPTPGDDPAAVYLEAMVTSHANLYRLVFDQGIATMLAPVFGPDLLNRGDIYTDMAAHGLALLAQHPGFLSFFEDYGVRVRFYGDYRAFFDGTPYAYLTDLFDRLTAQTAGNDRHRLFFGVCADDAAETVARLSVEYYTQHGHIPDKRALVEQYYGEYVPPLNFFIGFDQFSMFDVPLLTTGCEDLYFTVSPSLYLTERQLREILYDHLFTRRLDETDYGDMSPADWSLLGAFYRANRGKTLGVGARQPRGEYWYPLPQVELLPEFLQPQPHP